MSRQSTRSNSIACARVHLPRTTSTRLPFRLPNHTKQEQHKALTNTHNHQKPRHEPPEIHQGAPTAAARIDEVIRTGAAGADEVWQWRDDVGCHDEEGEVVVEEGGGEDHEEEADCEDLR